MRIIAGANKGRKLETLEGLNTRPMMDRMKESVFNVLGPYFDGGIVLDLFGGSGALSLEALSRGCEKSYIVEVSKEAAHIIRVNITALKETSRTEIYTMDYMQALRLFQSRGMVFDLIFLDPPFRMRVLDDILTYLTENKMISENGNIVCQYLKANYTPKETDYLQIIKEYHHASGELTIFRYHSKETKMQ
jgi:16S rRNA (guanine(966)-N(2))-methyltransferase RsmD